MTIEPISKEEHKELLDIYENNPGLFLQNKGYEKISKDFSPEEQKAFDRVTEILKKSIKGFRHFDNFRICKQTEKVQLRLHFNWNWGQDKSPFTGVGYILVDELLNGFGPEK